MINQISEFGVEFGVFRLGLQIQLQAFLEARTMCFNENTCCNPPWGSGMANYPTGPHQTKSDPTGHHRITPHSTSYFLPQTPRQSLTHVHLANTFDNRCTRKVTDINTIVTNLLESMRRLRGASI